MEFTTKEAFLLDALEYYTTDTNRRCNGVGSGCYYSPIKAMKDGVSEGCLIGRHLTPENQRIADATLDSFGIETVIDTTPEIIPEWMKDLGTNFLGRCQSFHDQSYNWGINSISDTGATTLESIILQFNLDKSQFQKYLN